MDLLKQKDKLKRGVLQTEKLCDYCNSLIIAYDCFCELPIYPAP